LEKSETKYHKACANVELARQDWQIETYKGCIQMQSIEIDRISSLEQLIKKLTIQLNLLGKKMQKVVDVFEAIEIDITNDIKTTCKKYGTCQNEQEIYLYDIFAENTKNIMNKDRRIANLSKWSQLFETDVKSQTNSLQGLIKVKNFAKENPNFNSNNDADVNQKVESVKTLKILYEASLHKVKCALSELLEPNAGTKPTYEHSSLMNTIFDKQGVPLTILKLPVSFFILGNSVPSSPSSNSVTSVIYRPSAPSAPISPTRSTLNYPSNSTISSSSNSSSAYSSLKDNTPIISMPMPQPFNTNSYDTNGTQSASSFNNYAGIETSSTSGSSISTSSSISPAALSSVSSLSTTPQPSTDSTIFHSSISNHNNNSYLLTTSTSINLNSKLGNQGLVQYDNSPPSYITATSLKNNKKNHAVVKAQTNTLNNNTNTIVSNSNNNNKSIKDATDSNFMNNNNKKFIENHYNNSVHSSDGKNLFFFFAVLQLS
jgi:hypothetical protein